jgi:hypothetical protein
MQQLGNNKTISRRARAIVSIAAALLGAVVLCQPDLAYARGGHGGGGHGGFHGGGFHGGFHGHVAAMHRAGGLPCTTVSLMSTPVSRSGL